MNKFKITDFKPYELLFPELSKQQLKIFVLYNNFVSLERIQLQLDISRNTLYTHLKRICEKYNVESLVDLKEVYSRRKDAYIINIMGRLVI